MTKEKQRRINQLKFDQFFNDVPFNLILMLSIYAAIFYGKNDKFYDLNTQVKNLFYYTDQGYFDNVKILLIIFNLVNNLTRIKIKLGC